MNHESHESALNFVAAAPHSGAHDMTATDSDLTSWLVMSGDLLGSSRRGSMFDLDDSFIDDAFGMPHITPPGQRHPGMMHADGQLPRGAVPPYAMMGSPEMAHHGGMIPDSSMIAEPAEPAVPTPKGRRGRGAAAAAGAAKETKGSKKRKGDVKPEPEMDLGDGDDLGDLGDDVADPNTKRQKRLERNREIAKACRRRKRERISKLEEEVVKLRQYNQQLEKQVNKGRDGRDREVARKTELMGMKKLLDTKCTEGEMKNPLAQYKEMYSDFGRERNVAIQFHMNQLKGLLIPNTVSKMTMWSLQQDDEFYDEKKNQKTFGGGIWNMLCSELQFSDEQKKTLLGMRHGIRQQRKNVAECLRILKELETRVASNFESMQKQMEMVMSTISPTQQAKFLLWIERNKACTFMINNLWQTNEKGSTASSENEDEFDDSASTMGMSVMSSSSKTPGTASSSVVSSAKDADN